MMLMAAGPVLFCSTAKVGVAEVEEADSCPHGVEVPTPTKPSAFTIHYKSKHPILIPKY
jgi:hypothetical protein